MKKKQLRAVGITCGIGSMLVGARLAGFEVQGNIEWRKYYHAPDERGQNTFRENFPKTIFKEKFENLEPAEIERMMEVDLALGHPECGNFSQLGGVNKGRLEKLNDPSDIPLFVELVARLKPTFFVMDDLPKSFGAFPMEEYVKRLPEYDLFPEWISNWGYGNVQKHRNRMFMVGAKKSQKWAFVPGEAEHELSLKDVIDDLPAPRRGSNFPNHDPIAILENAQKNLSLRHLGDRPSWKEVAEFAKANWREGQSMTYHATDGTIKYKPGCKIEHWSTRGASVQDGGSYKLHPRRFTPLTFRERARIQGFPDDFVFYGTKLNAKGEFNPDKNIHMMKQTGKAMPVQFCHFVSRQVAAHLKGEKFEATGKRVIPANDDVDGAKSWYCSNIGYANQKKACDSCWLFSSCSIRSEKYKIGPPPVGRVSPLRRESDEAAPSLRRATSRTSKPAEPRIPRARSTKRFVPLAAGASRDLSFTKKEN